MSSATHPTGGPLSTTAEISQPLDTRVRLHWIECLRGIAVFLDLGVFGVIVFFCISGYIIPYSVISLERKPALSFPIGRFFRLYPAYWVSIFVAAWAFHPPISLLLVDATMA